MAISNFLANKWSAIVESAAYDNSVAGVITSSAYQSEVTGANQLMINLVGDITVGNYTADTDMTVQSLSDTQVILALNQQKYFAFGVDDVNVAKSQGNWVDTALEQAGRTIALAADTYVLGSNTYGDAGIPAGSKFGSIGSSIALTTSNVEQYIDSLATALRTNNVLDDGYVVVPPKAMSLIRRAGITSLTNNSELFANRTVGQYAGLTIVESNQVTAAGAGTDEYQIIAMSKRAIPMGVLLNKMELTPREKQFGYVAKGLYVFGAKPLFPKEIAVLSATIA